MKTRLKMIRKELHITQAQLAEALCISKSSIEAYEYGRTEITDRSVSDICRIYNINEDWLRTGEGEMMKPLDREGEIARITDQMLDEVEPSIRNKLHGIVADMTTEELEIFYKYAKRLVAEMEKENPPS